MPFLRDYACPEGHVTEHLHMGDRASAPAGIPCECGKEAVPQVAAKVRHITVSGGAIDLSRYALPGQEPWAKRVASTVRRRALVQKASG